MLKPPGTKRLKLKCDEPLSNVAFNFNLRRFILVAAGRARRRRHGAVARPAGAEPRGAAARRHGRAVQVHPIKATLKPPGTRRLKLKYYQLPSSFAFKFYLRRFTMAALAAEDSAVCDAAAEFLVRRCRLTVSKPVLKAPMVSALEATI